MQNNAWLYICAFVMLIILMCGISCCKTCSRRVPFNYLALFTFTLCMSYVVAGICSYYDPVSVFAVTCMTTSMVVGLTFVGCFISDQKAGCIAGFSVALVFVLLPMIILSWFFYARVLFICISALIVLLSSIYIILDAHVIAKRLSVDEYIFGALTLYVDIIQLFLHLLAMFGEK